MTAPQLFADPAPQRTTPKPRAPRRTTPPPFIPPLTNLTRQTQCRTCRAIVAEALDAPTLAFHVQLDPVNITQPHHELQLLLTGRRTYTATPEAPGRYRIHRRDSYEIVRTTRTPQRPVVLAEHHCGTPAPGQPLPATAPRRLAGERCPF